MRLRKAPLHVCLCVCMIDSSVDLAAAVDQPPSSSRHTHPSTVGSQSSDLGYGYWFDNDEPLGSLERAAAQNEHLSVLHRYGSQLCWAVKWGSPHSAVLGRIESLRELDFSTPMNDTPTGRTRRKLVLFNLSQKNFTVTTK
jgi:hypothetical protein